MLKIFHKPLVWQQFINRLSKYGKIDVIKIISLIIEKLPLSDKTTK